MTATFPEVRVWATTGDPCGVGPELLIRCLSEGDLRPDGARPVGIAADEGLLVHTCRSMEALSPAFRRTARRFLRRLGNEIPLLQCASKPARLTPGRFSEGNAAYVRETLDGALAYAREAGGALVTGPVDKRFFAALGLPHAGHTEYLARLCNMREEPLMLFDAPALRVAVMTRHIPLAQVAAHLSIPRLRRAAILTAKFVSEAQLGFDNVMKGTSTSGLAWQAEAPLGPAEIPEPGRQRQAAPPQGAIAVAGLDPHCGEWGVFSKTDLRVKGWVEKLRREGLPLAGPYPADSLFLPVRRAEFSAFLCWYHDQGMLPVKLLAFEEAVNVTLGLNVLRTSPAHGVAYDLAGTGQARPGSFRRALRLALALGAMPIG
jgi:4-hydroxythreonine-4-phosphate dehydrogenase